MTCFYNALGKGQSNAQLPPGEHSVHCFLAYGHFTSCFHFHTAVKRTGHTFFDLYLDIKQLCDAEVTNFFHFLIFLAPHSHTHVWEQQSSQRWSDTCANICIWFLCFNTSEILKRKTNAHIYYILLLIQLVNQTNTCLPAVNTITIQR